MITFFDTGGNILSRPKEKTDHPKLPPDPNHGPGISETTGHCYEICIKGQLSEIWADWFDGMAIEYQENDRMILYGCVADQSALMGILNKLVHLNLTLISLNEIKIKKEKK